MINKSRKIKILLGITVCIITISLVSVLVTNTISDNAREREELAVRRVELSDQLFYALYHDRLDEEAREMIQRSIMGR